MKLNTFEQQFEAQIVKRGQRYFKEGNVINLEQISETNWQADVMGSDDYIVDIVINEQGEITYIECDCPYGNGCKHAVATLYAIQAQLKMASPAKKKLALPKLLQEITKEQLIELILSVGKNHRAFLRELELEITPTENEVELATKIIVHHLQQAQERRTGFIKWGQTLKAIKGIELIHTRIQEHIDGQHYFIAIDLAELCMHYGLEALQYSDDSDGDIGGVVEDSIELLHHAIDEAAPNWNTAQKAEALAKMRAIILKEELQDWSDWRIELLYACLPLCTDATIEQQFLSLVQAVENHSGAGWYAHYIAKQVEKLKYKLQTSKLTDQQAEQFLDQHPDDWELRERLIQAAMAQQQFEKVLQLAKQGMQLEKKRPIFGANWLEYTFIAHEALGHQLEMCQIAEQLLLAGNIDYFERLKEFFTPEEWRIKREDLFNALEKRQSYLYEKIIVNEQQTERILKLCQKNPFSITQHYSHLVGKFDQEVMQIFVDYITSEAAVANNRSHYKNVCRIIRTMSKAGYQQQVGELVAELKVKYARRPAFVDELNQVSR